jgi:hypothetical protein
MLRIAEGNRTLANITMLLLEHVDNGGGHYSIDHLKKSHWKEEIKMCSKETTKHSPCVENWQRAVTAEW